MKFSRYSAIAFICFFLAVRITKSIQNDGGQDDITWHRALELKDRLLIVDAHSHDLFKLESSRWPKQVTLSTMKKGGMDGLVQNLPLAPGKASVPVDMALESIKMFKGDIEAQSSSFDLASMSDDFERIRRTGRRAVMLGLEYFHGILGGRLDSL